MQSNIHLLFGSWPFILEKDTRERFSMSFMAGSDLEDLITNKITVQEIYDADDQAAWWLDLTRDLTARSLESFVVE